MEKDSPKGVLIRRLKSTLLTTCSCERLFFLDHRSLWSLFDLVQEYVLALPIRDTDLFQYTGEELDRDANALGMILAVTLKKVFRHLRTLKDPPR